MQACAFWMWPSYIGLGPSWGAPAVSPVGCQTILDNDLQKDLLALILNSLFAIFAWCPWYKPRSLYQTILLHCWNSHLPLWMLPQRHQPSTTTHPSKGCVKTGPNNQSLPQWVKFTTCDRKQGINTEVWRAKYFKVITDQVAHAIISWPL